MVEAMRGRVSVASVVGRGSTFTVSLARAPQPEEEEALDAAEGFSAEE
jgi:signal transduction histidine kinase